MPDSRVKFRVDKAIKGSVKPRKKSLAPLWAALLTILVAAVITLLVSRVLFYLPINLEPGIRSSREIRAPFSFIAEDTEKYQELLAKAREESPRIYVFDSAVQDSALAALDEIQKDVSRYSEAPPASSKDLQAEIKSDVSVALSDDLTTALLSIGKDRKFYTNVRVIIKNVMARGVIENKYIYQTLARNSSDEQEKPRLRIVNNALPPEAPIEYDRLVDYRDDLPSELNRQVKQFFPQAGALHLFAAVNLADLLVEPNIVFDADLTNDVRKENMTRVRRVTFPFEKNRVIVQKGQVIVQEHVIAMNSLNENIQSVNMRRLPLIFIMIRIIIFFIGFHVHKYRPDMPFNASSVILVALPALVSLGLGRILVQVLKDMPLQAAYAFPAGLIGILAVLLFDARIGLILVSWGAFIFGFMVDDPVIVFKVTLLAFIGGITGVSSLYKIRERKEMLMAGFRIALVNFVGIMILEYIDDPAGDIHIYGLTAMWGLGSGIACAVIAFFSLNFFEVFFGAVTDIRLLELTGIRQKLLSEMEEKSPGSYQHSLNVAKLAEPAAIAVGVNYLLVRAGAYYHDIGKMIKPKYYSENQTTPEDKKIYQNITPNMAVLIIKKHIREGIDLGRKHGLPQEIIDFIPQHHGTSLIRYFYSLAVQRAEEAGSTDEVREEDFRYPGPKPQSIETAIVMLADSAEAITTSKMAQAHLDEDDIRRLVHTAVLNQFNDGQFDECNMTLRDLHLIEETFVKTLVSRYHHRVRYPEAKKPDAPSTGGKGPQGPQTGDEKNGQSRKKT